MNGAALAMKKIAWTRTHAKEVLAAAANGGDIVDVQQSVRKHENEQSDKRE